MSAHLIRALNIAVGVGACFIVNLAVVLLLASIGPRRKP